MNSIKYTKAWYWYFVYIYLVNIRVIVVLDSMKTYQDFLNEIFDEGGVVIPKKYEDNNITGTFKYPFEYCTFKRLLYQRYSRLKKTYENTDYYKRLLVKIKEVANRQNWKGAYAELVAYDILNRQKLAEPIALENSLAAETSIAQHMNKSNKNKINVNLDGYISEYELYFDVKILADTVSEILDKVINQALRKAGIEKKRCNILPEYDLVKNDSYYSNCVKSLSDELAKGISDKNGLNYVKSNIVENLAYRIKWGGGVNFREGSYDPYRNAEEMKDALIFRYAKKFLLDKPFFLVMVNFPWYNQLHDNSFDMNPVFYRSLARRTFMEYRYSKKKMDEMLKKYDGNSSFDGDLTVNEVSRKLSGIVFIDDLSIKEDAYNCWVYINPNADNKSPRIRSYIDELLRKAKDGIYDDFEYDNY